MAGRGESIVTKIPFEKTILPAYRFGFVGLPSVVGAIWLPLLVFLAFVATACMWTPIVPPISSTSRRSTRALRAVMSSAFRQLGSPVEADR